MRACYRETECCRMRLWRTERNGDVSVREKIDSEKIIVEIGYVETGK